MNWLIVEDHPILLNALCDYLKPEFPDSNVFLARNGLEAIEIIKKNSIDLIITDIEMPQMDGLELVEILKREKKEVKTIIYTTYIKPSYVAKAQNLETDAYVVKAKGLSELTEIITKVLNGGKYFDKRALKELELKGSALTKLSERQLEVATLISKGISTSEIAEKLNISIATVKTHRVNIYNSLDVNNAVGLANLFFSNDLL